MLSGLPPTPRFSPRPFQDGDRYDEQLHDLAGQGADAETAVFAVTTEDVRSACDVLAPVYQQTAGLDGCVSIEVDPRLSRDAVATLDLARRLRQAVDRDNLYIKIPATVEALAAITQAVSEGISVNVTLIFSLDRYRAVMDSYLSGLEQAAAAGRDLTAIRSVASFFVSRVDSEVDARLDRLATSEATGLKGKAAIANARLAYRAHEEVITSQRWRGPGPARRPSATAAVGLNRRQGPRLSRHHVCHRAGGSRHRRIRCPEPPWKRSPITAQWQVTRSRAVTTVPGGCSSNWLTPASTSTTSPSSSSARAWPSS